MADGPSNPKRPRPDETRDEDLYFEDGSVILSAKDADGDLVYFRVHRSVLTKQSTVFKDMFSVPSPPEMEMYDDLPLVHLHDSSKELKAFLQAMYDPSFLPFRRLQTDTPVLVAGPLKLATKYQADVLSNRIISHLETDWPTTLEIWDSIAYDIDPDLDASDGDASDGASQSSATESDPLPKQLFPDPVPFISLACESKLPEVLAIVFYSVCRNSTSRTEELSRMTRGDVELLMLGRERMMKFIGGPGADQLNIHSWVPLEDYSGHTNDLGIFCTSKACRYPVVVAWLDVVQDVIRYGDPLATIRASARKLDKEVHEDEVHDEAHDYYGYDHHDDRDHRDEMCISCKSRLSRGLYDLRQTLFDQLPFFFPLSQ